MLALTGMLALAALAALTAGCATPTAPPDTVDVRPKPRAAVTPRDSAAAQCVPEGGSCAAPNAVCCATTTCTGLGRPVCIVAY